VITTSWKVCCATAEKGKKNLNQKSYLTAYITLSLNTVKYDTWDSVLEIYKSKNATQVERIVNLAILLYKMKKNYLLYSNSSQNMLNNYNRIVIIITLPLY
jgi:hypothetical protein